LITLPLSLGILTYIHNEDDPFDLLNFNNTNYVTELLKLQNLNNNAL